jgi:hypothetical protein
VDQNKHCHDRQKNTTHTTDPNQHYTIVSSLTLRQKSRVWWQNPWCSSLTLRVNVKVGSRVTHQDQSNFSGRFNAANVAASNAANARALPPARVELAVFVLLLRYSDPSAVAGVLPSSSITARQVVKMASSGWLQLCRSVHSRVVTCKIFLRATTTANSIVPGDGGAPL